MMKRMGVMVALAVAWSGATETGLVFWMSIAVTGGPLRKASARLA